MNDEQVLPGGAVNQVTRRGNVVYRSGGPWVPAIHRVLAHLRTVGFDLAPEPLGVADDGREMISFLPGTPISRENWPACMHTDAPLRQVGQIVRRVHEATLDLEFPPETVWRSGPAGKAPGQIVRHGDLGPWNFLWDDDMVTGLIDWDFAVPGNPLTDVAQLALYFVPLRGEAHAAACGLPATADPAARLATLCTAYGIFSPGEVVHEIERLQLASMEEIEVRAREGRYPWTMFLENGEVDRAAAEVEWLRATFPEVFTPPAATEPVP